MESTTNATIMYILIKLPKEQLSLVVTQCLFQASTASDHAQLRPEAPLYSNFALPWRCDIMEYSSVLRACLLNGSPVQAMDLKSNRQACDVTW